MRPSYSWETPIPCSYPRPSQEGIKSFSLLRSPCHYGGDGLKVNPACPGRDVPTIEASSVHGDDADEIRGAVSREVFLPAGMPPWSLRFPMRLDLSWCHPLEQIQADLLYARGRQKASGETQVDPGKSGESRKSDEDHPKHQNARPEVFDYVAQL